MARRFATAACCVLSIACGSCGARDDVDVGSRADKAGDSPLPPDEPPDEPPDDTSAIAAVPFDCPGGARVVAGANGDWLAGDQARLFLADLPEVESDTPVAVIFAWHGVGDTAQNFRRFVLGRGGVGPSADPEFPFVLITPQGMRLTPVPGLLGDSVKAGMEWDIFDGTADGENLEAVLFESILGCLKQDFRIDASRIFTLGFSGGAIVANLLHARYPGLVAAVYAMSGAWFNDENQRNNVNTGGLLVADFRWPSLDAADTGAVILSHGGTADAYDAMGLFEIINMETCAQFARDFLPLHNRTVVDCPHQLGHQPHPQLPAASVVRFFKAHRAGVESPLRTDGLPSFIPNACALLP